MLKARENVARKSPFFASILFSAPLVESKQGKDMWTDGGRVYFNPDWVDAKENDPYIEGWFLHNILHCALIHPWRRTVRDKDMWGQACDYAINPMVKEYFQLPDDALTDPKYTNLPSERIYDLLEQQPQQPKSGKGKGQGGKGNQKGQGQGGGKGDKDEDQDGQGQQPGGMTDPDEGDGDGQGDQEGDGDGDGDGDSEAEQNARDWKRRVGAAMDKAKAIGMMPGNIERLIREMVPQERIDWKDIIRDMSRDAKDKITRTWSRRNRRQEIHMPGYGNDNIFRLVIALDVSGSVSESMLRDMCSECASLLDQDLITHVEMYAVDTRITDRLSATDSETIQNWKPRGGGGTDFSSAMDEIGRESDCIGMVFLTDMYTSSFGKEPNFPCVWVNWVKGSDVKAPYGRTVPYYET